MPAALKNTFCDPLNVKANKIQILGEGEQAGSFCPLSKHGLLQKKVLGWVSEQWERGKERADKQLGQCWVKILERHPEGTWWHFPGSLVQDGALLIRMFIN